MCKNGYVKLAFDVNGYQHHWLLMLMDINSCAVVKDEQVGAFCSRFHGVALHVGLLQAFCLRFLFEA